MVDPRNLMDPLSKMASLDPAKKAFTLFDEFKKFAFKGNVIDMAVGVIIGGAFGKIISSLVTNIITPPIDRLLAKMAGSGTYESLNWHGILFGNFLSDVVNFLIVAAALFLFIVKFLGWLMKNNATAAPPPPTADQTLLAEIRDLLKDAGSPRFHQLSQQTLLTEIRDLLKDEPK